MIHLSDIDLSISELNYAINEHYAWANRMLHFSLLGGTPDETIIDTSAHTLCCFSRWFSRFDTEPSRYPHLVDAIFHSHLKMHDCARELLVSIINKCVNEQLVQNYHAAQQSFINAIDIYKQSLITFRNMHDTLTGLPLRHLLFLDFIHLRAESDALWLLMLDIDKFKTINDTWGHNAGDDVLREVTATLEAGMRSGERIYRFGGEEFVVLFNNASEGGAMEAARRIRIKLEQRPVPVEGAILPVTVTGGLTRVQPQDSLHSALSRADSALYSGKNSGRNRCVMATCDGDMVQL